MRRMVQFVMGLINSEDGPTAAEYAVLLGLVIVVCATAITTLGIKANKTYTSAGNTIGSTSGS